MRVFFFFRLFFKTISHTLSVHFHSRRGNVGPLREGAQVKHSLPPGVYSYVNSRNPDDVEGAAGFHLEEKNRHGSHFNAHIRNDCSILLPHSA